MTTIAHSGWSATNNHHAIDNMNNGRTVDVLLLDGDNEEEREEEGLHISDPYWHGSLTLVSLTFLFATLITGIATLAETPGRNIGIALGYITMLILTGPLAFRVRCWNNGWWRCGRYVLGVVTASVLSSYKSVVLIPALLGEERSMISTVILYALTALWECSNAVLVLGGAEVLHKFNIRNYQQAVAAGTAPCQVKFMTTSSNSQHTVRRWGLLALWLGVGLGLREVLKAMPAFIAFAQDSVILEAELLSLLLSCMVLAFDVPCLAWSLAMGSCGGAITPLYCHRMQMVLPYGAVYLSSSPRDFWRKWSRPASQLIRYMVYYPLGGGSRPCLSIPIMFIVNANSHLQLGYDLLGNYDGSLYWLLVFLILGAAVTIDVVATQLLTPAAQAAIAEDYEEEAVDVIARPGGADGEHPHIEHSDTLEVQLTRGVQIGRWVLNYVSLRVCVWLFVHRCLQVQLQTFLEPIKW